MEDLTRESFCAALKKCQETERYHVLIITKYLADQIFIQENWLKSTDIEFNKSRNGINIYFPNGSTIRGISLSNNARGHKANLVLCEPWMLRDEDISCILRSAEILNTNFTMFGV